MKKAQYAEFNVPTCGTIAVWQLCRETLRLWDSHDGPELKTFGSMPWCSFPGYKLFCVNALLYSSLNLIHEFKFTSLFSPISHRSMRLWTSVFFCGCASNGQDSPKASPRVIFSWKNFIQQVKNILKLMKIEGREGRACWVQCAKMWQDCERQPLWNSHDGPELNMLGSMPWYSFPWQKLLPRLAQNCCTVQIWCMSLHACSRRR